VRRPAASLPYNFKPLFVDVAVPCAEEAPAADRLALIAQPTVSSPVTKVHRRVKPHLEYYGGPVMSNVKVVAVRWNSTVPADHSAAMEGFYRSFTKGAMFDWLSEYDTVGLTGLADGLPGSTQRIGHGTFAGTYTLTPAFDNAGTRINDSQIVAELAAHIAAAAIPPPELDTQGNPVTLYMIDFPETVTIKGGNSTSCVDYCAYHSSVQIKGVRAAYGILPAIAGGCLTGCGAHPNPFDIATASASHELVEAVTDPAIDEVGATLTRPAAWYDPRVNEDEIADICEYGSDTDEMLDGYWVQREWSNRWKACIVAPPPGALP
jgi:hypothetical protein